MIKNSKSEIDGQVDVVGNLIYMNYAFNRDQGMLHEQVAGALELSADDAAAFLIQYNKELAEEEIPNAEN